MDIETTKQNNLVLWVDQYSDLLYSWAFYKTSSKESAEDLVQDTFMSAIKSYESCKNKKKPKTWLFTILNNKIIDFYRKSAKAWHKTTNIVEIDAIKKISSRFDSNGSWTPEARELIETEETHFLDNPRFNKVLQLCINDLPKNWRLAIIAKYMNNKKGPEICKELGVTSSNYWQMLHRAKAFLKICLEKHWRE